MFDINDYVVYGNNGVYQVMHIGPMQSKHISSKRTYYTLRSVYTTETIYIPTDTDVYMRPIISNEEARTLLDRIPHIVKDSCNEGSVNALKEHYESYLRTPDCEGLIQLTKGIYQKQQDAVTLGKKLGQIDQRYWKRAEELLFSELAIALDMERDAVSEYISKYLELSSNV